MAEQFDTPSHAIDLRKVARQGWDPSIGTVAGCSASRQWIASGSVVAQNELQFDLLGMHQRLQIDRLVDKDRLDPESIVHGSIRTGGQLVGSPWLDALALLEQVSLGLNDRDPTISPQLLEGRMELHGVGNVDP